VRAGNLDQRLRCSAADHFSSPVPAFRTQVDQVICGFDHIHLMFDNQHCVSGIHKPVQDIQKVLNIRNMKTGSWFIQNVQGFPGSSFGKLAAKLYPLSLAAGQSGCGLSQADAVFLKTYPGYA